MAYQGYTNYETFIIGLWIDNDEGMLNYWLDLAEAIYLDAEPVKHFTRKDRAVITLADQLKESWEDSNPLSDEATPYGDLLNSALAAVNWSELAESLIGQIAEEFGEIEEEPDDEDDDEFEEIEVEVGNDF